MKKIAVVEDDINYSIVLKDILESEDYDVDVYNNPLEAYESIKRTRYDLLITDLLMDGLDGFQLIQLIERLRVNLPIIILTSDDKDENEVNGLSMSIRDYIRKPFNIDIFVRRVKLAMEYSKKEEETRIIIDQNENLKIDIGKRRVLKDGVEVHLTRKEFDLLLLLIQNKNNVITREEIVEKFWGGDGTVATRTIDVHIKNLRLKLKLVSIQTVYRVGYMWNE